MAEPISTICSTRCSAKSPSGTCSFAGETFPNRRKVKGGLLGADYKIENGRYRFARVFNGENWNPDLRAPLTQPGVDVKAGEYLLEVNGVDVRPPADVNKFLENTADQQVRIKVGPNADGKDAREVTVVPVARRIGFAHSCMGRRQSAQSG